MVNWQLQWSLQGSRLSEFCTFKLWWHCIRTILFLSCGNVKEKASNLLAIFTYHPLWFDLFFWIFDDELLFLVNFRSCIAVIMRHHGRVAKLHHILHLFYSVYGSWFLISSLRAFFTVAMWPCTCAFKNQYFMSPLTTREKNCYRHLHHSLLCHINQMKELLCCCYSAKRVFLSHELLKRFSSILENEA